MCFAMCCAMLQWPCAVAFKTVHTDLGEGGVRGQAQGTGQWTYWRDYFTNIGAQQEKQGYKTAHECTRACDGDGACAGVELMGKRDAFDQFLQPDDDMNITKCTFIMGVSSPENTKRTLIKAALGEANTLVAVVS